MQRTNTKFQARIAKPELKESNSCRFCGFGTSKEDCRSEEFIPIYEKEVVDDPDSEPVFLNVIINKYLPIRVCREDLYYPQVICSPCNFALDLTVKFFKKIAEGQKILSKIINEKPHEKESVCAAEAQYTLDSVNLLFSKENPVILAPKRRGRPRRDPNVLKTPKILPQLPSEYLELKPKRQSRRPARYNPGTCDSVCDLVIKEEPQEFSVVNENEGLCPYLNQGYTTDPLLQNKLQNGNIAGDSVLSPGRNLSHLKTDNTLLLGSIASEFTSLAHSENLMDLSKLSVIMDGDEEIFSSADAITCSIIKDSKSVGCGVTLQELCSVPPPEASVSKISNDNASNHLINNEDSSVVCLTVDQITNEIDRDSDASVRTIDFVVRKKVKRGKKTRRKTKKKLECAFCKKEFSHPSSLGYHRNSAHNNEKKFVCEICTKAFSHKQLLANHAYVHSDEKGFKCQLCPAKFKSKASLYTHNKSIHTKNGGFTCDQCGYQFNLKSSLKAHLRLHTGEKPYSCEFCNKQFSQKSNYAEHRRIHTGERPYKCTINNCDKAFTTASQLRNHKMYKN